MNNRAIVILLVVALITFSCSNQPGGAKAESPLTDASENEEMISTELKTFGKNYAEAWCSQKPEAVAAFFATDGSLTVNGGTPAIGREAIAGVAEGFMTAFPDMIVTMDSLVITVNGLEFHWTLTGTNTGPKGTGKKIQVSGLEQWQLDGDRHIRHSKGSFDAEGYNRQLKDGVDN